jgi:hypothetical protein
LIYTLSQLMQVLCQCYKPYSTRLAAAWRHKKVKKMMKFQHLWQNVDTLLLSPYLDYA